MELRDYQNLLKSMVYKFYNQSKRSLLLVLPTGAGKTAVASSILRDCVGANKDVYFIVHRRELLNQTAAALDKFGLKYDFIASNYPETNMHKIKIASINTLLNRMHNYAKPRLVIIDECHRIASKTWTEVFNYYNESLILGLTATPCRLDGQGLGKYFEEIVTGNINTQMLIDRGHLSPFKYYAPSDVDLSDINTSMGDFDQTQLAHVMNKPSIVGNVVEHYQKIIPGKKAIVFCVNVEHSIHVMNAFRSAGINAAQVDGNTPTQTRDSIINNFTNGQINILTNVNLFTEGFDVPHLDAAILCRPTHSLSLHLQMVGRALRTSPSKTLSYIIDHVGNYKRHGLPNDQRYWSLNAQKKTVRKGDQNTIPIKRCESCFHVNHAASIICSNCHTPFPVKTQELIPETEGELVEITEHQKKLARMEVGKAKSLAELQAIARERGYKPGWVFKMASLKNLR